MTHRTEDRIAEKIDGRSFLRENVVCQLCGQSFFYVKTLCVSFTGDLFYVKPTFAGFWFSFWFQLSRNSKAGGGGCRFHVKKAERHALSVALRPDFQNFVQKLLGVF